MVLRQLLFLVCFHFMNPTSLFAQVGIGTITPNASSMLDITSTEKGLLIPRVDITDLNNKAPITENAETGLLVFNTNTAPGMGFYYWTGTEWNRLATGNETAKDWFKEETSAAATSINNNIYTNGKVGIGLNNPNAPLHIFEATGTAPSPANGSLILEHGNGGGQSSIVFKSRNNTDSDCGYINYEDDGGTGASTENGLLTLGIENDNQGSSTQDDINISASGIIDFSVNENITTYTMNANGMLPLTDNARDLGSENNYWDDLFISGEIRSANGGTVTVTLNTVPDYIFSEDSFNPPNNRQKDLGLNGNRWRNTFTDVLYYRTAVQDSDRRMKENIHPLEKGLDIIAQLNSYEYNFKDNKDKQSRFGLLHKNSNNLFLRLCLKKTTMRKHLVLIILNLYPFLPMPLSNSRSRLTVRTSRSKT